MSYGFSIQDAMDAATKKVGIPGWEAYQWESVAGGHLLKGEVPDGVYLRGPRKGSPRFRHPGSSHQLTVIVSDEELQQTAKQYEQDTGQCWDCKGKGQVMAGWSKDKGTTYRACPRCGGSGKATKEAAL